MAARAVLATEVEDFQKWKVVTKEKPTAPPAGHVVVKMTLVPVNPSDILSPAILLAHLGPNRVEVGSEGVGYVEEVGANVTKVKKGQRVVPSFLNLFYKAGHGSWQDYAVVPEDDLFIPPDSIPDEVAAQFVINPSSVYGLLDELKLSKGDYLLQGAEGSTVWRQVIQLAKYWGIKTINIVRQDDAKEELIKLGADEVINSATEDVLARVKEITGGKLADGALDPVAGIATKAMASSVKNGGKVFVYGFLGSKDHTTVIDAFDLGRVNISLWTLFHFVEEKTPAVIAAYVSKLFEEKVLETYTRKEFKLEEFQEAIVEAEKPGGRGKVLLRL